MIKRTATSWLLSLVALLGVALGITSCDTAKKTNYLRDIQENELYSVKYHSEITIQPGDKLSILVTSLRNPELTTPFNPRSAGSAVTVSPSLGAGLPSVAAVAPADTTSSYLVDPAGQIQFPILGSVAVKGLSLEQVSELIRTRLAAGNYLKDAHVVTKYANLRVYLLGAFSAIGAGATSAGGGVTDRGSFHLDNPQTNILELIARVGGLGEDADFSRLSVIRRIGNQYAYYRLDMLSKNIFDSPAFYLQQNDIIYAEYRYRQRDTEGKVLSTLGYVTTSISTVLSVMALVAIFTRNRN